MTQASPAAAAQPEPRPHEGASAHPSTARRRVLKQDDVFAVMGETGEMRLDDGGADGLYFHDTRHLSNLEFRLGKRSPVLLGATMGKGNVCLHVDMANSGIPEDEDNGSLGHEHGSIHFKASQLIWNGSLHGRLQVTNHAGTDLRVRVEIIFEADFRDLFEVRGLKRHVRGEMLAPVIGEDSVLLAYHGLDDRTRSSRLSFSPRPDVLTAGQAGFILSIPAGDHALVHFRVCCDPARLSARTAREDFIPAMVGARRRLIARSASTGRISTTERQLETVLRRADEDLATLVTMKPTGPYPHAGIPWFDTVFGRDGMITALLSMNADPGLALGVIRLLAQEQATATDAFMRSQPGKILHEMRLGEMAETGEIEFRRSYGSADSTPLFAMTVGDYFRRTGDVAAIELLWTNLEAAFGWMDGPGDPDGDGFIEYDSEQPNGHTCMGWKDSPDSVSYADGRLLVGQIALCEIQGYAYAAKREGAMIAERLGHMGRSRTLAAQAAALREQFEKAFWCPETGTYALALDEGKKQAAVRSSNPGHLLMTGILSQERAVRVADVLMKPGSFSGWGIRTLAEGEVRYNPMSYHNGSIWPHDNALIALGMARHGLSHYVVRMFEAMADAAAASEHCRLPELFCGFPRRAGRGVIPYPVACSPQAWAAAALPATLQACLGMRIEAAVGMQFERPAVPSSVTDLRLSGFSWGEKKVSARFTGTPRPDAA